jgi:hypothetical protein
MWDMTSNNPVVLPDPLKGQLYFSLLLYTEHLQMRRKDESKLKVGEVKIVEK